jgi:hypothetical protein
MKKEKTNVDIYNKILMNIILDFQLLEINHSFHVVSSSTQALVVSVSHLRLCRVEDFNIISHFSIFFITLKWITYIYIELIIFRFIQFYFIIIKI